MVGTFLSHYEILEKLGEGGMGVVYGARDIRLDRSVAVKVLAPAATLDPERKRRFVDEAKIASSLNHPNIITIYEIDTVRDVTFIVMEYVRGKTVADLIGRKELGLGQVLNYAVQICEAMAAAHAAGIVHRDMKPANVMVTTDQELVKVLDFGLAKLIEPATSNDLGSTLTILPERPPRTEAGAILGTVAYMSPEQAEGRKVDERSDIFSFGSVVYEMISGRRAFEGDSRISILEAICNKEPKPITESAEFVPREIERIVALCLRKDPSRRFQHMADLKIALDQLKEEFGAPHLLSGIRSPVEPRGPWGSRRWRLAAAVAGGLVLVAAVAGLSWWRMHPKAPIRPPVLTRLTSDNGLTSDPALSPDGKLLAYASDRSGEGNKDIWVQQLAGGEAVRLTHHKTDASKPAFSPNGSKIAFQSDRAGGGIYVISALGGEERLIAKRALHPRFSPDGSQIAYWAGEPANVAPSGKIYVVASSGGVPRQLQPSFADARYPIWTPDGAHLLFQGVRDPAVSPDKDSDWWVTPLDKGPAAKTGVLNIFRSQGLSLYMGPGDWIRDRLLFSARLGASTNLWQVPISPITWEISGAPQRVTFGTGLEAQPSVGSGGLLAFSSLTGINNIWCLPIYGNQGKVFGEMRRLTQSAAFDTNPSLSADGRKLVFLSRRSGNRNVWIKDLERGKEIALTATSTDESSPIITADASKVAYSVLENQKQRVFVIPADGGVTEKVCDDCGYARDWSADGKRILYVGGEPRHVGSLNVLSGEKSILLQHPHYSLDEAHFSPDNHWIAFVGRIGPDRTQVFVTPFKEGVTTGPSEWVAVTEGETWDDKPRWSRAGNILYFYSKRDGFGCIWKLPLNPTSKRPVGSPSAVHHFHSSRQRLMHMYLPTLEITVVRDKIVFNMLEVTGNIWMTEIED